MMPLSASSRFSVEVVSDSDDEVTVKYLCVRQGHAHIDEPVTFLYSDPFVPLLYPGLQRQAQLTLHPCHRCSFRSSHGCESGLHGSWAWQGSTNYLEATFNFGGHVGRLTPHVFQKVPGTGYGLSPLVFTSVQPRQGIRMWQDEDAIHQPIRTVHIRASVWPEGSDHMWHLTYVWLCYHIEELVADVLLDD